MIWRVFPAVGFVLMLVSCARQENPPGGPRDERPPIVVETTPDTFQIAEVGLKEIQIRFSERISERASPGRMDDVVIVSPSVGNVRVKPSRDGITVRLQRGLEADRIYRITVRPMISDMFGNRLQDPFELVFSTGDTVFVPNVLIGVVEDRVTGLAVEGARVEALFPQEGDTVVHWNLTDADGIFSLRYVPGGLYHVRAFLDRNRDEEMGDREPQTRYTLGAMAEPPDTLFNFLSLITPDTSRASLTRVEALDSLTLLFTFSDFINPDVPSASFRASLTREGDVAPEVSRIFHDHEFQEYRVARDDSLRVIAEAEAEIAREAAQEAAEEEAAAQALLQEAEAAAAQEAEAAAALEGSEVPDSTGPPEATPPAAPPTEIEPETAPTVSPLAPRPLGGGRTDAGPSGGPGGGSSVGPREGLAGLILPTQTLHVVLVTPLEHGAPYEASVSGIINIAGIPQGGGSALVVWERPEVPETDSLEVPVDTLLADSVPALVSPTDTIPVDTLPIPTDSVPLPTDTNPLPADTLLPTDTLRVR